MAGNIWWFLKKLYAEIWEDNLFNGAAALAYYMTLSLFPATIFLLTLLPYLPIPDLNVQVMDLVRQAMPAQAADMFSGVVNQVTTQRQGGLLTFGIVFTLWSSSTGISAVLNQLNTTYDVKEGRPFWKVRGIALLLLLAFVVLIVGAFGLIVAGQMIQEHLAQWFGRSGVMLQFFSVIRWLVIALFLLLGFALTYYFGPNVEQKFRFITPGSVIGLILLVLASLTFNYYITNFSDYNATYGSIGAVIVLMLWLYIAGFVILLGSEINAIIEHASPYAKKPGEKKIRKEPASN